MRTLEDKIAADPDDWDAWLVYGDWLLEQGDVRGQTIRLEHQLRTKPMPAEQRKTLVEQHQQQRYEERWLDGKDRISGLRLQWRAGFILGVELWTWWGEPKHLAFVEAITTDPVGRLFHRLCIHSHCGINGFKTLAASPVLTSVRRLVLSDIGMDAGTYNGIPGRHGLDMIVASPHLKRLAHLDVSGNNFDSDAAISSSSSSSDAPPSDMVFADDKGEVLGRLSGLSSLNLRKCSLGDAATASLVRSDGVLGLTSLDLGDNRLTAEGVRALAASDRLGALKSLVLRDNPIGPDGWKALASAKGLGALERLDLSFTLSDRREAASGTADKIVPILAAASGLPRLRELDLRGTGLSDAGLARLIASEPLRRCQILR